MPSTRDDFEHWLFEMDDRLEEFVGVLPTDISSKMDYSAESLSVLEGWLMTQYESVNDILKESEKPMLDMVTRYVGETLRKNLGGVWNIDLKNKKNVFYRMPVIEKQGSWTECPVTLVTASTDRRNGSFIAGVLNSIARRYGTA
jgi:hypothetical protein